MISASTVSTGACRPLAPPMRAVTGPDGRTVDGDAGGGVGGATGGMCPGGVMTSAGAGVGGGALVRVGPVARTRPLIAAARSLWAMRELAPMVRPGRRTSPPRVSCDTNHDGRYASMGRPGLIASHHS